MCKEDGLKKRDAEAVLVLAREAVSFYLEHRDNLDVTPYRKEWMGEPRGTFVSIKKRGQLRGCIGTIKPTQPDLAWEIAANAVSAAFKDPRFPPVNREELPLLSYAVDILSPLEKVSQGDLDPQRYGILVQKGSSRGLLLPDLPQIQTVNEQLELACEKAGISSQKGMKIFRFTVVRFKEEEDY